MSVAKEIRIIRTVWIAFIGFATQDQVSCSFGLVAFVMCFVFEREER